ncbi:hypothetical protein EIP86_003441 [Pleurotus ostreatoroseus]|nr:hypothetical protein EIP86_003441 [Pleurotus ostreatoroseus]
MAPIGTVLLSKRTEDLSAPALSGIIIAAVLAATVMVFILIIIKSRLSEKELSDHGTSSATTQRLSSSGPSETPKLQSRIPETSNLRVSLHTTSAEARSLALHLHAKTSGDMLGYQPSPAVARSADAGTKASRRASDDVHSPPTYTVTGRRSSLGEETASIYSATSAPPEQHDMLLQPQTKPGRFLSLPSSSSAFPVAVPRVPPTVVTRSFDVKPSALAISRPFVQPRPIYTNSPSQQYN